MISILGLYGSLRVDSCNLAVLRAMYLLAPNSIEFVIFEDIFDIPIFSPDRSEDDIPVVNMLSEAVAWADGIVIATPEYAGGISGVMKDTLD